MAEPAKQIIHFSLGILGQELLDGTEIFQISIPAESPEEATRKLEKLIKGKKLRIQHHSEPAPLPLKRYARNLRRLGRLAQRLETSEAQIVELLPKDLRLPPDPNRQERLKSLIKNTSELGRELEAILHTFPPEKR